jgi:hypothetical protein
MVCISCRNEIFPRITLHIPTNRSIDAESAVLFKTVPSFGTRISTGIILNGLEGS